MARVVMFQKQADGSARPWRDADRILWRDAIGFLSPGRTFKVTITHPRSSKDHAHFFAVIQKAFENNRSNIEFIDAEHLRAWALCEAGFCAVFDLPADAAETLGVAGYADLISDVMSRARAAGYSFVEPDARGVTVKVPLSISWSKLDQTSFNPIRDAVFEVLTTRIVPGATVETLFNATLEDA
ncbi:MAG: hypothetical protein NW215_10560 [Hyphomicrobiales bacterium]|nr:hypothetical protein [Hyphomicrobiales bacterium]